MPPAESPSARSPVRELTLTERIKRYIEELEILEKTMHQLRMECEQRHYIWEAVQREMAGLQEQATIFRYKMDRTQDQPSQDQPSQDQQTTQKEEDS